MIQQSFMKNNTALRYVFYSLWFVCALLQSAYTDLFDDEAYYWMFSQNMDWGYFDHPPLSAALIRCGTSLFGQNELGVRFFIIVLNLATIFIIEKLTKPQNLLLFYGLISSMAFLHFGFLALPDAPLLFFAALFYYFLSSYLEKENKINIIGLLIAITLMMYSKYHGILVIGFSIISNIKILKRKSFILVSVVSLLMYAPHFFWLYNNDFITLKYHLFERTLANRADPNILDFLAGLPVCLAGLSSIILIYYCYKFKPSLDIEKIYKVNFFGPIVFFFIMSFKGRVEVNWISISIIPMIVILFKQLNDTKPTHIKLMGTLSIISVLLIFVVRLFLMFDFAPKNIEFTFEFRNQQKWADDIKRKAGNLPVFFMNSYTAAAKHEFYAKSPSFSLNNIMGRKNHYTLKSEEVFWGDTVFLIANYSAEGTDTFIANKQICHYKIIPNYHSYSNVKLEPVDFPKELTKNTEIKLKINLTNHFKTIPDFAANKDYPSYLSYHFFKDGKLVKEQKTTTRLTNNMIGKTNDIVIHTPEQEGNYVLNLSITTGWLPATINSGYIKVKVK